MEITKISPLYCIASLFLLSSISNLVVGARPKTYIVHVQHPEATVFSNSDDRTEWYHSFFPTTTNNMMSVDGDTKNVASDRMVHTYKNVFSGFAAQLTQEELDVMATKDGFVHAYPDGTRSILTTNTPNFLGLNLQEGIWKESSLGKGVIIGVLDTGITPSHPSFSPKDMPPPPSKWKGRCEFNGTQCNNKIIGARAFIAGAEALMKGKKKKKKAVPKLPFDYEGHGTHTASTAAGAFVRGANVLGNAWGTAVGMAPRAHLAIYKVCLPDNCADSDILAAMDAAVEDGVDVLSLSLGGDSMPFYEDAIAIGAFGAIQKGVFVSCSAGNSGPNASSISNEAPWILTVAASTMDRSIRTTVKLGNNLEFHGESLNQKTISTQTYYPMVYAGASGKPNASFCGNTSFIGVDVKGKIVLCERGGDISRTEKGVWVRKAGGVGMILTNRVEDGYSILADPHVLPASHIGYTDGNKIMHYIKTTPNPTAAIVSKGTMLGVKPAPAITSFSSRGPSVQNPGILKPDITGPGVSVLAAWPFPLDNSSSSSHTGANFDIISGTSMSCPHLSGIAALVKASHPKWSPAAIKSAIMTTAQVTDRSGGPILDEWLHPANFFAVGAGHVSPRRASDPGLVYDITANGYIPYLCGLGYNNRQVGIIVNNKVDCHKVRKITQGELNYPSISATLGGSTGSLTFSRTVKNVGEANSVYWLFVEAPKGVSVTVNQRKLVFSKVNQERKFYVTISAAGRYHGGATTSQGYLNWVSNKRTVKSPISITFKK